MTPAKKIYWICTSIESTTTPVLILCLQNSCICSLKTAISLLLFIIATLQMYFHLREAFSFQPVCYNVNVRQNASVFCICNKNSSPLQILYSPAHPSATVYLSSELSIPSREIHNKHIALAPQVHTSQLNLGFSKRRLRRCQQSIKEAGNIFFLNCPILFVAFFASCSITIKTVKMSPP